MVEDCFVAGREQLCCMGFRGLLQFFCDLETRSGRGRRRSKKGLRTSKLERLGRRRRNGQRTSKLEVGLRKVKTNGVLVAAEQTYLRTCYENTQVYQFFVKNENLPF